MISRRSLLAQIPWVLAGCTLIRSASYEGTGKLMIGLVSYGEGVRSIDQYQRFVEYLQSRTKAVIELEPAYNEVKAVEQIERRAWSLVFAPPGLAAIAVSRMQYIPLFSLQGVDNLRSVLLVLQDSPIQRLEDVNGQRVALGQPGSATGYYVPLYDLYGTTPREVRIAPTPQAVLEGVTKAEVEVGAVAKDEFDAYRSQSNGSNLRILHTSRRLPSGAVLMSPHVEGKQQALIRQAMNEALPAIAQEAGYVPNAAPPDYKTLISFIEKVKPIEARIHEQPAPLYQTRDPAI